MNKYLSHLFLLLICGIILLNSCMNDELWLDRNKPNLETNTLFADRAIIIINEGNFTYGNASLTYYNITTGRVENDVYYRQNGIPLGDIAQSAVLYEGLLYVVVNNSGKITVMNMGRFPSLRAFEFTGKITGLTSPRYIEILGNTKGYISDMYARKISIFHPGSLTLTGSISVADPSGEYYRHPTEQMITYGKFLFTNCYSYDNQILVIDTESDQVADSIRVLKQPSSMVADRNNKLWVLCDGGYQGSFYGDESPGLVRIDMETQTLEKVFIFRESDWPRRLSINGTKDTIYYISGDIWRMDVTSRELPEGPFILAEGRLFYSLGVDPVSSEVYACDAIDYVQQGLLYRYDTKGKISDTIRAGVNPGFMIFLGER